MGRAWRMVTPPIISRIAALTGRPETAQICDSFLRSASVSRTEIMCVFFGHIALLFPRRCRKIFRPQAALGTGDAPSKRVCHTNAYASASAAHGGVIVPRRRRGVF